jgi:hypothetical protein
VLRHAGNHLQLQLSGVRRDLPAGGQHVLYGSLTATKLLYEYLQLRVTDADRHANTVTGDHLFGKLGIDGRLP